MADTLKKLRGVIDSRKNSDPETSYVAKLFNKGIGKICEKVGEEATETIIAAISQKKKDVIYESADLMFHLSVLWAAKGIQPAEIMQELENRMGISGIDEKAARKANKREKNSKRKTTN